MLDVYHLYERSASVVNWKSYNINDLFRAYLDNEHTELKENYLAAIICRLWGYSGRIYTKCQRHIPYDQCVDCVIDSIRYVLDKRVWLDPNSSLYGDPSAPDKAIHIAMKRQLSIMLSKYNAQRRLSNFNTMSLDGAHEQYADATDGLFFEDSSSSDIKVKRIIKSYFNGGDYLDGLILDMICYNSQTYFNMPKLISDLKNIPTSMFKYYKINYDIDDEKLKRVILDIRRSSNVLLKSKVKSLLYRMKEDMYAD